MQQFLQFLYKNFILQSEEDSQSCALISVRACLQYISDGIQDIWNLILEYNKQ